MNDRGFKVARHKIEMRRGQVLGSLAAIDVCSWCLCRGKSVVRLFNPPASKQPRAQPTHQIRMMKLPLAGRRDVIVIGGSAGALDALRTIVGHLPSEFPASILVTIHVASDFPSILPEILSRSGPLQAVHPRGKEVLKPGIIYVAPPDYHLLLEKGCVVISRGPRENRHRPAIDPLFRSAARSYGSRVAGVVLSGELDDGAAGLMAIRMRKGLAVVQDPTEAMAPEMPRSAIQYAGADYVLRAEEIAELLVQVSSSDQPLAPAGAEAPMSNGTDQEARQANLESDNPDQQRGRASAFACPECHGVLWELEEGSMLRFRCRVGHAFTADALGVAMSESSEEALWAAMRALEEKAALLRRLAPRSAGRLAANYEQEAAACQRHVDSIRKILLESQTGESRAAKQQEFVPPDAA